MHYFVWWSTLLNHSPNSISEYYLLHFTNNESIYQKLDNLLKSFTWIKYIIYHNLCSFYYSQKPPWKEVRLSAWFTNWKSTNRYLSFPTKVKSSKTIGTLIIMEEEVTKKSISQIIKDTFSQFFKISAKLHCPILVLLSCITIFMFLSLI